jgi:hypothetical protein
MVLDLSEIDYPALVEAVERFARQKFHLLCNPLAALPSRFNNIWHPGEGPNETKLEPFLEKIRCRAAQIEAKRAAGSKKPRYDFFGGMECLVIVPEEGEDVIKLYEIYYNADTSEWRCSKFVIDGTYQDKDDPDFEPEKMYYCNFDVQHHPNSTIAEAQLNFAVSSLWSLYAGGSVQRHERFLCVRQSKMTERATIPEMAEAVEKNRGIFIPSGVGGNYLILTHDPRSQSLLLFNDMHSGNFRKNMQGEVRAIDAEGYQIQTDDLSRVGDLRGCVWKLKESIEKRGMDPTLPEEVERIIRRDERSRREIWPSLCLDKNELQITPNEMYQRKVFCWR